MAILREACVENLMEAKKAYELGADSAITNLYDLRMLVQYVEDKIIILPGGGIAKHNYMGVVSMTGVKEVHGTKIVGNLT